MHEKLEDWLDGTLDPSERAAFEAHLGECGACREEFARCRTLAELAAALPRPAVPASLGAAVRGRLAGRSRPRSRLLRALAFAGAAAAAVLLAAVLTAPGARRPGDPAPAHAARTPAEGSPALAATALGDWFEQFGNASSEDVAFLVFEALELDLVSEARRRLRGAFGAERERLRLMEEVLVQAVNGSSAHHLIAEAGLVARGGPR